MTRPTPSGTMRLMSRANYSSADLHIHTTASDGTASPREVLEWVCAHTDLSVIAICDHNAVEGAHEAQRLAVAEDYPVEVVIGQEVESADGHVLALWTPTTIPPHRSPAETVADIHSQGGLAIIAHPFAPRWWHKHGLERGTRESYDVNDFDGVEVANSTPLLFFANFHARAYWRLNHQRLAATGGSDAHMLSVIGSSRTLFPGSTADDLRDALERRTTHYHGPRFSLTRGMRYARKVPEIKDRDRDRKEREAKAGHHRHGR